MHPERRARPSSRSAFLQVLLGAVLGCGDETPRAPAVSVLLLAGSEGPATSLYALDRGGDPALVRISPDPATLEPGEFVWVRRHDAERAIFSVGDQLFTYDLATGERVELTLLIEDALGFADFRQYSFPAEGAVFYVVGTREGRDAILAFDLETMEARVVYEAPLGSAIDDVPGHAADPEPDPTGARLAFVLEHDDTDTAELVTVPTSGGAPTSVSQVLPRQSSDGTGFLGGVGSFGFSPDGLFLEYTADLSGTKDWQTFAAPVDLPEPAPVQIVPALPGGRLFPNYYGARAWWTPDSAALVYESDVVEGVRELFVASPESATGQRRLHPALEAGRSIPQFGWYVSRFTGMAVFEVETTTASGATYRWYAVDPSKDVAPVPLTPELSEKTYAAPLRDGSPRYVYVARLEDGSQALHLATSEPGGAAPVPITGPDALRPEILGYGLGAGRIVYLRAESGATGARAMGRIELDHGGASSDTPIPLPLEQDEVIGFWRMDADATRVLASAERAGVDGIHALLSIDPATGAAERIYVHEDPSIELVGFDAAW